MKKNLLLTLFLFIAFLQVNAQIYKFQAAYIYNISKYLEWPEDYKSGSFIIGVLTADPIIQELEEIAKIKKRVNQTIEIKEFKAVGNLSKCHILFIPEKKTSLLSSVLSSIEKNSTLVITNQKGAINSGAAINFVLDESKLKFEMKKSTITSRNIKINSSLEKLALKVY